MSDLDKWKEALEQDRKTANLSKLLSSEFKRTEMEVKDIVSIGDLLEVKIKKDNENNQYIMDNIIAIHKRLNDIEARIFAREHGNKRD